LKKSGGTLEYSIHEKAMPFSEENTKIHFLYKQPIVIFKKVVQKIEVISGIAKFFILKRFPIGEILLLMDGMN